MNFRDENVDRIILMTYLVTVFDYFTQRNIYSYLLSKESSYSDQKNNHEIFNNIFGLNTPFNFFDSNEYADKSIINSKKLERYLSPDFLNLFNLNREDVLAFLHQVENDAQLVWLKVNHIKYPSVMNNVLSFALNNTSFELFKDSINYYETAPFPIQCNIKAMVKVLLKAENKFQNIVLKRIARKHRKELVTL